MSPFARVLATTLLVVAAALPAHAQSPAPAQVDPTTLLEAVRKDMAAVRAAQEDDRLDEAGTLELRKKALSAQTRAEEVAAALAPELADVQARLAQLGPVADGIKESPDIAAQRAQLMRAVSTVDSQVKLARLLAVEAGQAATTASESRRQQLGARLEARRPSTLGPTFWRQLSDEGAGDWQRLTRFGTDLRTGIAAVQPATWAALAGVVVVLVLLHVGLQRLLLNVSATRLPSGRLRRSLHALGEVVVRTVVPGLAAHAVVRAMASGTAPTAAWVPWLEQAEAIVWFGAFVAGLGSALLMPGRPSWRLPPLPDAVATRLRWFPAVFALTVVVGWISVRAATVLDASVPTAAAVQGLGVLTYVLVFGAALWQARRAQPVPDAPADAQPTAGTTLWWPTLRSAAWLALAVSAMALAAGFLAFAGFLMNQLVWTLIVVGTAYLLMVLVDDLFMSLLAPMRPAPDPTADAAAGATPGTREQTAVLLSGLCRVGVGLLALTLLLAPFGEGPGELFRRAGRLHEGLSIGELSLRPMALFQGIVVLVLGMAVVRGIKRWLARAYMPTTRMDAGMRLSVTTLFGYAGAVAVIAIAMSAVGMGLERVAWVASALSVGIGFGLQAVVQNFVSGLILLAERPVKVGDWVSLSGVEGDIRRINVRATEIQMGDRSTVIVPNSEFITKIVRNVTYAESLGMVQFKLPMPLATDTNRARAVLLDAFRAHPSVLASPAPNVQLDGIDGTNLVLNASGFVASPRAAYGVKSDLLFDALTRLREAGLLPAPAAEPAPPPPAAG